MSRNEDEPRPYGGCEINLLRKTVLRIVFLRLPRPCGARNDKCSISPLNCRFTISSYFLIYRKGEACLAPTVIYSCYVIKALWTIVKDFNLPRDKIRNMQHHPDPSQPIGIFDSGVGGLSVLRAVRRELPHESLIFVGDQGHVPYGSRPRSQILDYVFGLTRFLLNKGAKLIVVACNTASAVALHDLREAFPEVPFVGMEPAVKPAAETTHTGKVGVLATPTTFAGELYASVVERFAQGVELFQSTCPGLVEQVEAGDLDGPATRTILEEALNPMLAEGIDTVVMGCTHYPFVIPLIEQITGPGVRTIDPAPAIARQIRRVLAEGGLLNPDSAAGTIELYTSADPAATEALLPKLLGEPGSVSGLTWENDTTVSD